MEERFQRLARQRAGPGATGAGVEIAAHLMCGQSRVGAPGPTHEDARHSPGRRAREPVRPLIPIIQPHALLPGISTPVPKGSAQLRDVGTEFPTQPDVHCLRDKWECKPSLAVGGLALFYSHSTQAYDSRSHNSACKGKKRTHVHKIRKPQTNTLDEHRCKNPS